MQVSSRPLGRLWLPALALLGWLPPGSASAGLKYDLRVTGGGTTAFVSAPGQVVSIDLFAVVTGAVGNAGVEGFQNGFGSISSTDGGNIGGNLSASLMTTFAASGATTGKVQNLDNDSDSDLGSKFNVYSPDFMFARAGSMQTAGTAVTDGTEFKLATISFTVTSVLSLSDFTPITISFRVPNFTQPLEIAALWTADGMAQNSQGLGGGTMPTVGSSVSIAAIPEPSSFALLGLAAFALAARRRSKGA